MVASKAMSQAPEAGVSTIGNAPPVSAGANWCCWVSSVAMMLCSWLSYIDRQILAVLSPMILRDTGLSAQSYAEVVSVFSIAYMVANPLWGSILAISACAPVCWRPSAVA